MPTTRKPGALGALTMAITLMALLGLLGLLALGGGDALAKKPPKPPPPDPDPPPTASGTLICTPEGEWFEDLVWFTMTPGGSDETDLDLLHPCTDAEGVGSAGFASRERHNGKIWRLQTCEVAGDAHPDGAAQKELFVIAEGDTAALQLTADTSMEFSRYTESLAWGPGDEFVSWVAHTWVYDPVTDKDVVDESGIYMALLSFDANGDIVGVTGDPVLVAEIETKTLGIGIVVVKARSGHDWSPDGTQVAWHHLDKELYVTDIDDPTTHTLLTTEGDVNGCGGWSSRDQILFSADPGIKRIDADGGDEAVVVTAPRRTNTVGATWSPDGEMVAYAVRDSRGNVKLYTTPVDNPKPASTGVSGQIVRWLDD